MGKKHFTLEYAAQQPWGDAWIREAKLVAVANIFEGARNGGTLYDVDLYNRIAHFCRDLDGDLEERYLGIWPVVQQAGETSYQAVDRLREELATRPRGHWAVFENGGHYDAYISNGLGWTDTESGVKFRSENPREFTFEAVYATIFAQLAYHLRPVIYREIVTASSEAALQTLTVGQNFKNAQYAGQTWSNCIFLGTLPPLDTSPRLNFPRYGFRLSRKGRKTTEQDLTPDAFLKVVGQPWVMPAQYAGEDHTLRLRSLEEQRQAAAQEAWDVLQRSYEASVIEQMRAIATFDEAAECRFDRYASRAVFWRRGERDIYYRHAYTGNPREDKSAKTYLNTVTFSPGTADIIRNTITSLEQELVDA